MHGKLIKLDEKELDQLVLSEFDRVERFTSKNRRHREEDTEGKAASSKQRVTALRPEKNEDIFNKEEEKFISDAVQWLSTRNNRDTIIASIWERLTESDPESFFASGYDENNDEALQSESSENGPESGFEPNT